MRRRITDEVDIPVHTRAVTIGHELKDAGMDKTTADTIGDGFEQVAVAVTGLSRVARQYDCIVPIATVHVYGGLI